MNNTNKRKHRCKEKLPPLNGGIDKRQITKKRIKNLNFQTKHATRQQACKAKMHRFDDLPTRTQLQTKVGAARKLPPLNGGIDKRQITKKQLKNKLAKQNTPHGNKPAKPKCTVLTTYRQEHNCKQKSAQQGSYRP